MAVILTTVLILSLFGQGVSAAPEKTADVLYNRVLTWKQTFLSDIASTVFVSDLKFVLASLSQSQYVQSLKDKLVSVKNKAERIDLADEIVFVVEQVPLEKVLNKNPIKNVAKDFGRDTNDRDTEKEVREKDSANNDTGKDIEKSNEEKLADAQSAELNQSAVAGKSTMAAMEMSRSSAPKVLQEDLELLARIIYAEARGESFEGQVAVGAVVLNRVAHPDFPKTIREVIYQPGQFTAVRDRQIELKPNETAYRAALAALEGYDPSNGALFYYNPKTATDPWIRTRSEVKRIGNHKFCI